MNIDEFKKVNKPSKRKSRLDVIHLELVKLKEDGYSLSDMVKFAVANGIDIKPQAISQFLKRRETTKEATRQLSEQPTKEVTEVKTEQRTTETKPTLKELMKLTKNRD